MEINYYELFFHSKKVSQNIIDRKTAEAEYNRIGIKN